MNVNVNEGELYHVVQRTLPRGLQRSGLRSSILVFVCGVRYMPSVIRLFEYVMYLTLSLVPRLSPASDVDT